MAGKRSNGEGSIRKLPNGKWHGQIMAGYQSDGKRHIVSVTENTKAEVIKKIRKIQEDRENHICVNQDITFAVWADRWYESYRDKVIPSTYCNYQFTLKILKSQFGCKKLQDLLPLEINQFLAELVRKKKSMSLIRKCRTMLIQIFDAAEDNELIVKNPARRTKIGKATYSYSNRRSKKDAFSNEEQEILFTHLPQDMVGYSIRFLLVTGLRVQELLALTKEDIKDDGSFVSVSKAVKMVSGKPVLGPPKSAKGVRTVPIPETYRYIAYYLKENGSHPFLWTSPNTDSHLYGVGSFRKRYYKVIDEIGRAHV